MGLCVAHNPANYWTDMVFLYSEASHRSMEGSWLFLGSPGTTSLPPTQKKISLEKNATPKKVFFLKLELKLRVDLPPFMPHLFLSSVSRGVNTILNNLLFQLYLRKAKSTETFWTVPLVKSHLGVWHNNMVLGTVVIFNNMEQRLDSRYR